MTAGLELLEQEAFIIRKAIKRKFGHGGQKKLAELLGYPETDITRAINGNPEAKFVVLRDKIITIAEVEFD